VLFASPGRASGEVRRGSSKDDEDRRTRAGVGVSAASRISSIWDSRGSFSAEGAWAWHSHKPRAMMNSTQASRTRVGEARRVAEFEWTRSVLRSGAALTAIVWSCNGPQSSSSPEADASATGSDAAPSDASATTVKPPLSPFTFAPNGPDFMKTISADVDAGDGGVAVAQLLVESDKTKVHLLLTIEQYAVPLLTREEWLWSDQSLLLFEQGAASAPKIELWAMAGSSTLGGAVGGRALQPINRSSGVADVKGHGLKYSDGTPVASDVGVDNSLVNAALKALSADLSSQNAGDAGSSSTNDGGKKAHQPGYPPVEPPQLDPRGGTPCVNCTGVAVATTVSCGVAAGVAAVGCGPWAWACALVGEAACALAFGIQEIACYETQPGPCCPVLCQGLLCCAAGTHCAGPVTGQFCCFGATCGEKCCEGNDVCYQDLNTGGELCCAQGQILCPAGAAQQTCCLANQTCNALSASCCTVGTLPCGTTCCAPGQCSGRADDPNATCCPAPAGQLNGACPGMNGGAGGCCPPNAVCANGACVNLPPQSCTNGQHPCWDGNTQGSPNFECCDTTNCCGQCCTAAGMACAQGACLPVPP
jgi:hypothetical protein